MKRLQENIAFPDDVYCIADSALYSEDNIKSMREGMKWITRIPSTLNLAKYLLASDLDFKPGEDQRYSFYDTTVEYGGVEQKWVVVHSTEMQKRKDVTFDRKVKRKVKESQKDLKDLKKIKFACEEEKIVKNIIFVPTFRRCTQKCHLFSQYGSSLKMNSPFEG